MNGARGAFGAGLAVLVGGALLVASGATEWGGSLARTLGSASAPVGAFGSAKLRKALLRAGQISLRPAATDDCAGAAFGARPLTPQQMPSSLTAPAPWRDGVAPLVSLWVDPCRLARIHEHPDERGRAWEEIGWLSHFESRALRFASPVGVRIHGGESRGRRPASYRFTFRDSLGARPLPAELLAPELEGAIETLIADANTGSSRDGARWQFLDAIAFDVARQIGADAPFTRPVRLSVNGGSPNVYVLIERIGADSFERRHGHRDLELARGKLEIGAGADVVRRHELSRRIDSFPAPLSPAAAAELFDLDSLIDGFVAALYCASGDLFQAALARDLRGAVADGRWQFIPWDLDQSFRDPKGMSRFAKERDVLAWTLHRAEHDGLLSGRLLRRLLHESREARQLTAQRATDALNHQLTPAFALALVSRYRALAAELGVDDLRFLDQLERYFAERPAGIYAQLERFLEVGPPLAVEVGAPAGALAIDGFTAELPYRGRYPRGTMIALDVTPLWRPLLIGFRVNGALRLAPSGRLELAVDRPTRIEALFDGAAEAYGSRSTG